MVGDGCEVRVVVAGAALTPLEAADFAHDLAPPCQHRDRSAGGPMTATESRPYTGIIPDHSPAGATPTMPRCGESVRDIDSAREHFLSGGENCLDEQRWNDHVLRPQGGRWTIWRRTSLGLPTRSTSTRRTHQHHQRQG